MTTLNILVTGATSGLGRDAALHLARLGHRVFATGRNRAALDELQREAGRLSLETVVLDVTDKDSIDAAARAVDAATAGHGLDVLINNAGYGLLGPADALELDRIRAQYETNVFGLLAVTQAFVPAMRRRRSGRVINISSVGGRVSLPFMGVYNSTKFAVEALSDAMRMELGSFGIDVVVVQPGYIRTHFTATSLGTLSDGVREPAYRPYLAKADAVVNRWEAMASGPEVVSRAIEKAITARRPRARYVAPASTALGLVLYTLLPTRLTDAALRWFMGLTAGPAVAPTAAVA
jgi:NAD(P)-dependent dehydrogenase (short-subunit alcohol dehydrogenase family)